jgi:HEAT repeats/Transglutaminase-like superfamily
MKTRPAVQLRWSIAILLATLCLLSPASAEAPEPTPHGAGISILASDIGNYQRVEDLLAFVDEAQIRDVIVDWAWITLHWKRTDFEAVEKLVKALEKRGVRVAAMYRPRFKAFQIDEFPVAYQVDGGGRPRHGFCEIRYADADARKWGTAWATEILARCPSFDEVVIYNPTQGCQSEAVKAARAESPDYHAECVRTFLSETRAAIRKARAGTKLGLVLPPSRSNYDRYQGSFDVARPFVFIREGAEFAKDWDAALEVMKGAAEAGPALAKITWGADEKVSDEELSEFIRIARAKKGEFVFWSFWTAFCDGKYDVGRLSTALDLDPDRIVPLIRKLEGEAGEPTEPVDPEVVRAAVRAAAETASADAYKAMLKVAGKYGEAAVEPLCELLDDPSESVTARWCAAGALGKTGSAKALPSLLRHSRDESNMVRWLSAGSLGACGSGSDAARGRLLEMAKNDPAWRTRREDGQRFYYVRDAAKRALQTLAEAAPVDLTGYAVVAVKDFMRLENSGPAVANIEFPRYFPVIDPEQIVLGRWVSARTDNGKAVPVEVSDVSPDPAGNLIHTFRLPILATGSGTVVTVTSLVLRRERPHPEGAFAILAPEEYPEAVRPYLSSTRAVDVDHPYIRQAATKILRRTRDALDVAHAVADLMRGKSYQQEGPVEKGLPTSASVLRRGGSCCGSAVSAAAILRACGIPTQITYCPNGYIHGIIRFYLDGYGWCRTDATCGTGRLPFVQSRAHRSLVRLYDMPIEMEALRHAYAWPFHRNGLDRKYEFKSEGKVLPGIRFAAKDEAQARREKRVAGRVSEPFPHLESGSWNALLAIEPWTIDEAAWDELVESSRFAAQSSRTGFFSVIRRRLGALAGRVWVQRMEERMESPDPR